MRVTGVTEKSGIALVLIAAALWATVGIGAQLVPHSAGIPPEFLGLARTGIAGPALLLAALTVLGRARLWSARLNPVALIVFAVSNAVFQIGLFKCFALLGVTITVFLTVCLPPILAMVIGWLRRREPVTPGNVIALAHAIVGLWMIADDRALGSAVASSSQGLGMAVIASFAFVAMSDAARSLGRTAPPLVVAGAGLSLSSLVLLLLLPAATAASLSTLVGGLADPATLALVVYLGLAPTALAYVCYCTGIARCRSALVALIASMIEPAIAAGLAVWILSDAPTPAEAMGCALLMLAMLVLWHGERSLARKRHVSEAAAPSAG